MRLREIFYAGCMIFCLLTGSLQAAEVTFQVIMSVQESNGIFNPEEDEVVIRGSFNDWGEWGEGEDLVCSSLNDSIWAATVDIAIGQIEYRYVIVSSESDQAENIDIRILNIPNDGIVVEPVYFNNEAPENAVYWDANQPETIFLSLYSYPNPFNSITNITLNLDTVAEVRIMLFNLMGREVYGRTLGRLEQGAHTFSLNASGLASGVYILTVHAGSQYIKRELILLK